METDILYSAAQTYKKLTSIKYHIVLGRKGKTSALDIVFMPDNFYHLAGLHKLKQKYPFQQRTSKWVLEHILNRNIVLNSIKCDKNFYRISERLYALNILEQIMDSPETKFYSYDRRKISFATKITANYLAKGNLENTPIIFSFFVRNEEPIYCMNSIFQETTYDYSLRQTQYTVLLKKKHFTDDKNIKSLELYRHNTYQGE